MIFARVKAPPKTQLAGAQTRLVSPEKQAEKTYDYAAETTKQVLALSTGILTVTITFSGQFASTAATPRTMLVVLGVAWFFYFVSIFFGLQVLAAITSAFASGEPQTIWDTRVPKAAASQLISFFLGTVSVTLFGISKILCAVWGVWPCRV